MFDSREQHEEILRISSRHLKFDVHPEDVAVWNLTEHPEVEGYVVVSAKGFVTYEKWNLIKNPNSVTGWTVKRDNFSRGIFCDWDSECIGPNIYVDIHCDE